MSEYLIVSRPCVRETSSSASVSPDVYWEAGSPVKSSLRLLFLRKEVVVQSKMERIARARIIQLRIFPFSLVIFILRIAMNASTAMRICGEITPNHSNKPLIPASREDPYIGSDVINHTMWLIKLAPIHATTNRTGANFINHIVWLITSEPMYGS